MIFRLFMQSSGLQGPSYLCFCHSGEHLLAPGYSLSNNLRKYYEIFSSLLDLPSTSINTPSRASLCFFHPFSFSATISMDFLCLFSNISFFKFLFLLSNLFRVFRIMSFMQLLLPCCVPSICGWGWLWNASVAVRLQFKCGSVLLVGI